MRGTREYLSATRRPYDAPTEAYTGSEKATPPPPLGTQQRRDYDAKIGELRAKGWSFLRIAAELDTSEAQIAAICARHGFIKGERG
jgi:hypothetical protein